MWAYAGGRLVWDSTSHVVIVIINIREWWQKGHGNACQVLTVCLLWLVGSVEEMILSDPSNENDSINQNLFRKKHKISRQ